MAPVRFAPEILRGGQWIILAPLLALAITTVLEAAAIPALIGHLLILVLWFGSFGYLVKVQYGRRTRIRDVVLAFMLSTILSLLLLSVVVLLLFDFSGLDQQP